MPKFNVGDRVRVTENNVYAFTTPSVRVGSLGTVRVVHTFDDEEIAYDVQYDEFTGWRAEWKYFTYENEIEAVDEQVQTG